MVWSFVSVVPCCWDVLFVVATALLANVSKPACEFFWSLASLCPTVSFVVPSIEIASSLVFKVFTVGAAGSVGCLAVTVCFVSVVSTVSFVFPVDGASTSLFFIASWFTFESCWVFDGVNSLLSVRGVDWDVFVEWLSVVFEVLSFVDDVLVSAVVVWVVVFSSVGLSFVTFSEEWAWFLVVDVSVVLSFLSEASVSFWIVFLVDSCVSREGCSSLVETDSGSSEDVFVVDASSVSATECFVDWWVTMLSVVPSLVFNWSVLSLTWVEALFSLCKRCASFSLVTDWDVEVACSSDWTLSCCVSWLSDCFLWSPIDCATADSGFPTSWCVSAACAAPPPINSNVATKMDDAPTLNLRILYLFSLFFINSTSINCFLL